MLGAPQIAYDCFVGLTGEVFAKVYVSGKGFGDGVADYRMQFLDGGYVVWGRRQSGGSDTP